jgi:SAM-dependent methyltransferase
MLPAIRGRRNNSGPGGFSITGDPPVSDPAGYPEQSTRPAFNHSLHGARMTLTTISVSKLLPAVVLSLALGGGAAAQDLKKIPIPYVPSQQYVVDRMLKLADVNAKDFVLDLGSGDGRIPITAAANFGARGFGVDINPRLVEEATENAKKAGVADRVSFRVQDLFDTKLDEATVISLYLPVAINVALRPRLLELKPGTRIVAHQFAIGDWDSDLRELVNSRFIYLWYVPASASGTWQVRDGEQQFKLHLWQTYQRLSGVATNGKHNFALQDLFLRGDRLDFAVALEDGQRRLFQGRVNEERIEPREGTQRQGWHAVRESKKPTLDPSDAGDEW